jgi:hypothetical protein
MGKRKKRGLKNRSENFFNERKKHISTRFIVFERVSIIGWQEADWQEAKLYYYQHFFWQQSIK